MTRVTSLIAVIPAGEFADAVFHQQDHVVFSGDRLDLVLVGVGSDRFFDVVGHHQHLENAGAPAEAHAAAVGADDAVAFLIHNRARCWP